MNKGRKKFKQIVYFIQDLTKPYTKKANKNKT